MRDTCGCVRSAGVRQRVARLGPLQGGGGSGDVVPNGLAPYYAPAATVGHLDASTLTDVAGDVPILEGVPTATCVWAARLGAIACWQAARKPWRSRGPCSYSTQAGSQHPTPHRRGAPYAYHQTWIGSGADFNGYWDGEAILGRQQSIAERINRRLSDETGGDDDDGDDDGVVRRAGAGVTTVWHGRGAFYARAALSWCSGPWSGRRDSNPRPSPWQWLIEAAVETSHHLRGHQPARLVTARPHSGVDGRG